MITNIWRTRLVTIAASIVAIWLGNDIAQGDYFWPIVVSCSLAAIGVVYLQSIPLGTLLLGGAVAGYIVGNRGFAQISLTERFPLLPAEFVLLSSGGILAVQSAINRSLPVRRDGLNAAILAWMCISSIRLYYDVREYGVMAIRDYATIYYAVFFFFGQNAGGMNPDRKFLLSCLNGGFVIMLLIFPIYILFPDFFINHLTFRGTPLIYYKGDLLGTFLAAGAMIFFARYEANRSRTLLCLCLVMVAETMASNNRASMLGLMLPAISLSIGGRHRFLAMLGACGLAAALLMFVLAEIRGQPWEQTPLYGMYERAVSLTDPFGEKSYSGEETSNKGDNNAFRTTWWKIIINDTIKTNPWYGLGWGNDIAEPFAKVYYPEGGEDFSARSPHNIVVTIFARTGVAGLIPFLALVSAIVLRFWRAIRENSENIGLWCAVITILVSSCFGIVLEGPMGAVIFWTILGLACSKVARGSAPSEKIVVRKNGESPVAKTAAIATQTVLR